MPPITSKRKAPNFPNWVLFTIICPKVHPKLELAWLLPLWWKPHYRYTKFCERQAHRPKGVTSIFFWGGKVIFPDFFPDVKCFFPVENSDFGRPKKNSKTNFCRFQKWKAKKKKKKKKKKKDLTSFYNFSTSNSNFPPSLSQFSFFSSQFFSPFLPFFLASFFPI